MRAKNTLIMAALYIAAIIYIIVLSGCGGGADSSPEASDYAARIADWQQREALLDAPAEKEGLETVSEKRARYIVRGIVAAYKNQIEWVADDGADHWRTSAEFVANDYNGDCEDISIFVYTQLRLTGLFPEDDLSLRVLGIPDSDDTHVVVAVYTDGVTHIVDNGKRRHEIEADLNIVSEFNLFAIWQ